MRSAWARPRSRSSTLQAAIAAHDLHARSAARRQFASWRCRSWPIRSGIAICFREEKYISPEARRRPGGQPTSLRRVDERSARPRAKKGVIAIGDPQVAAQVLTGADYLGFVWFRDGGRLSTDEFADHMVELSMSMLNTKPY